MSLPKLKLRSLFGILLICFSLFLAASFFASSVLSSSSSEELEDEHLDYIGELGQSGDTTEFQKQLEENRQKQEEVRRLLDETRQKKVTLQNEIAYQDAQIELISLKIEETEKEIEALTGQINRLEGVLVDLSEVFSLRVVETYKLKRIGSALTLLFGSNNVSEFIARFHYLQRIQENDRKLMLQMQATQTNYEDQRAEVQELHDRLETQQAQLASLKAQKQRLLEVTKNDEERFQEMLEALRADELAIQKALSSLVARIAAGIETGSPVSKGQIIGQQGNTGNVFPRPSGSCPECGSHLHFMVFTCDITNNGLSCHTNPRSYIYDGQHNKPMDTWKEPPNQEYGQATCTICGYTFHTGIDISNFHGAPIYAIEGGTVYYGVDGAGGKYALVKHRDDFWTGYWHLQ